MVAAMSTWTPASITLLFQYPLTGRDGCSRTHGQQVSDRDAVSVPSDGS